MAPAITIQNLAKRYTIGRQAAAYRTLRESITDSVKAPVRRLLHGFGKPTNRRPIRPSTPEIWALRDVSFDIQPGEVVGIIGRNGAGKSTLLKVLSRIADPTSGRVELRGRVGSLLEVGTGFHPELTGRENIFLNGAILGMTKREVVSKFDDIVAFAEIDRFLDTPVKRYSSGMHMRLAFAVAAHLDPEIIVVDEVLAVGDAAFQSKCLGKMSEVSRNGRTVLFVSHNMTAVKSLCSRAILIEAGRVTCDGDVDQVVNRYLDSAPQSLIGGMIPENAQRYRDVSERACFRSVQLTDLEGNALTQVYFGQPFRIGLVCDVFTDIPHGLFEVSISTKDGTHLSYTTTMDDGAGARYVARGRHEVWATMHPVLLPRQYTIDLGIHSIDGTTADYVRHTLDFTVLKVAESGADHYPWGRTRGLIRIPAQWRQEQSPLDDHAFRNNGSN
jgi:lipopolysaccharide transport system ATP-binding protein